MASTDDRTDVFPKQAPRGDQVTSIPIVEERISVGKREVEKGRVRVHVDVEERSETVSQQLSRDDVQVERVPMNVRVSEIPHVRIEGNTTVVPVVEEVLVVEKALFLIEEVHIRRCSTSETVDVPVTIKSERVRVEREATQVHGSPVQPE